MSEEPFRGDKVMAALVDLSGEASTDEIAKRAGIGPIGALVTCGQLSAAGRIAKAEKGSEKGNPRWRVLAPGEEKYEQDQEPT